MSIENEPPVGQHEWDKGFYGARGRCSRCGARASLAMGGFCSWMPSEEKPKGDPQAARKANLNIAVSVGGARFKSEGEATERLAFAVWTLVTSGCGQGRGRGTSCTAPTGAPSTVARCPAWGDCLSTVSTGNHSVPRRGRTTPTPSARTKAHVAYRTHTAGPSSDGGTEPRTDAAAATASC